MAGETDFRPGAGMGLFMSAAVYAMLRLLERRRLTHWRLKE
jgi:hypothetical protein